MGGRRRTAEALLKILVLVFLGQRATAAFISWEDVTPPWALSGSSDGDERTRVIVVAHGGGGDATTVQSAVDLVPHGNPSRIKIVILPGIYKEKVVVPKTKPFVSFLGNESSETVISWHARASDRDGRGEFVGTLGSATVAVEADFFCARGITFENTAPGAYPGAAGMQAVALRVSGDKAMFFRCRVLGSQDTLFDHSGRHFFLDSHIQGSIDFIFGSATSLYQDCTLRSIGESFGAVAASQRSSPGEGSGFSFVGCRLTGSGNLYLGRAWGAYARVVYSHCVFDGVVNPQGWSDWGDPSRRRTAWFGEYACRGEGADQRRRVGWARSLTFEQARPFLGRGFIDGSRWLRL
ncbi:pectin lyase-like superfamily protein [Wolffia australiana]